MDCSGPEDEERREETAFVRKRDMMVQNRSSAPSTAPSSSATPSPPADAYVGLPSQPPFRPFTVSHPPPSAPLLGVTGGECVEACGPPEQPLRVLPYHSALAPAERAKSLEIFSKENPKQPVILVCTDRTSRGVDFENADVEHVLLFDFPRDPSEYLRRVGRTGRAGRIGRVTALVLGKQVALARGIMAGNKKGERVHPVPDK